MFGLNPWVLLGAVVLFIAGCFASYEFGHGNGVTQQKVADQKLFDKVNEDLREQKAQAAEVLRVANEDKDKAIAATSKLKADLGVEREKNQTLNRDKRRAADSTGLYITTPKTGLCGNGGGGPQTGTAGATPDDGAVAVRLPDGVSKSVLDLAETANALNIDYGILYRFLHDPAVSCIKAAPAN